MSDAKLLRLVTEHLRSFERSVFRLETLDDYNSDVEDDAMRRYFAGDLLGVPGEVEYYGMLRLARAAGKPWQRVHAVTAPTPYLRFEIDVYYAQTEPSGEDIRILEHPDLPRVFGRMPVDFWLFDDSLVLEMRVRRFPADRRGGAGDRPGPGEPLPRDARHGATPRHAAPGVPRCSAQCPYAVGGATPDSVARGTD
jgi:uncharacterized protein DUF6879